MALGAAAPWTFPGALVRSSWHSHPRSALGRGVWRMLHQPHGIVISALTGSCCTFSED